MILYSIYIDISKRFIDHVAVSTNAALRQRVAHITVSIDIL